MYPSPVMLDVEAQALTALQGTTRCLDLVKVYMHACKYVSNDAQDHEWYMLTNVKNL